MPQQKCKSLLVLVCHTFSVTCATIITITVLRCVRACLHASDRDTQPSTDSTPNVLELCVETNTTSGSCRQVIAWCSACWQARSPAWHLQGLALQHKPARQHSRPRSIAWRLFNITHLYRGCAGECMPQTELLLAVASALTRLCGAYPPTAAELFCEGALGGWVRLAQRRVAKQPLADREGLAALLLKDGQRMVEAFGLAVPQARGRLRNQPCPHKRAEHFDSACAANAAFQGASLHAGCRHKQDGGRRGECECILLASERSCCTLRIRMLWQACLPRFTWRWALQAIHKSASHVQGSVRTSNKCAAMVVCMAAAVARAEALPQNLLRRAHPRKRTLEDLRLEQPELIVGCWAGG